jgi:hypothetical protein
LLHLKISTISLPVHRIVTARVHQRIEATLIERLLKNV